MKASMAKAAAYEALDYLRGVVAGDATGGGSDGKPTPAERREAADLILRHVGWTIMVPKRATAVR